MEYICEQHSSFPILQQGKSAHLFGLSMDTSLLGPSIGTVQGEYIMYVNQVHFQGTLTAT